MAFGCIRSWGYRAKKTPAVQAGVTTINSKRRKTLALAVYYDFFSGWYHCQILSAVQQIPIRGIPIVLIYDKMGSSVFGPAFFGFIHAERAFFTVTDGGQT